MNKKIAFALAGIGMSLGLTTTAASASSSECRSFENLANYYCNVSAPTDHTRSQCLYYIRLVDRCGLPIDV